MRELTQFELSWVGAGELHCRTPAGEDCNQDNWSDLLDRFCDLAKDIMQTLADWWNG